MLGLRLGCDVPTIAAAVDARVVSSRRELRLQLAPKWRPPRRSPPKNRERELAALAERHCQGRLVAMGGGGYKRENLARGWTAVVAALIGNAPVD